MVASIEIRKTARRAQSVTWGLYRVAVLSVGLGSVLACGRDTAAPPAPPAAQVYLALQLNQHAIIMALTAPYDTVQLTATPLSGAGTPLAGLGQATFHTLSTDSSVTVSSTGLVTARYVTGAGVQIPVIASLQDADQGVTHVDTAFIVVTTSPSTSALATFSLQPAPGDSAKRALGDGNLVPNTTPWPVTAIDVLGDTLCGASRCTIPVYYHASNPVVATIDARTGVVTRRDTGHVELSAQTLVYGHPYRDSVDFRVGLMTQLSLYFKNPDFFGASPLGPDGSRIVLGIGGVLTFVDLFFYGPIQATFSDPAFADSASTADIGPTGSGNVTFGCDSVTWWNGLCDENTYIHARRFPQVGTVQMHIVAPLFPSRTYEIDVVRE